MIQALIHHFQSQLMEQDLLHLCHILHSSGYCHLGFQNQNSITALEICYFFSIALQWLPDVHFAAAAK